MCLTRLSLLPAPYLPGHTFSHSEVQTYFLFLLIDAGFRDWLHRVGRRSDLVPRTFWDTWKFLLGFSPIEGSLLGKPKGHGNLRTMGPTHLERKKCEYPVTLQPLQSAPARADPEGSLHLREPHRPLSPLATHKWR